MHEEIIEHIMSLYNEGLEELMGAQKYVKCAHNATNDKDRHMYADMAHEEVKHASMLTKSGDSHITDVEHGYGIHHVWKHLKQHLSDWSEDLVRQIEKLRA
jgi:hypothetical protein